MMKKSSKIVQRRAYINAAPSLPEAQQRVVIEAAGAIAEWYVESHSITRADFLKGLRPGNLAVVAWSANLAQTKGNKMARVADLLDARGEVHAKGAILLEAATGLRSDHDWPKMKAAAIPALARMAQGRKSALNGNKGQPPLRFTDEEKAKIKDVMESRRYRNWPERKAAVIARGITPPSRTWIYNHILSFNGYVK